MNETFTYTSHLPASAETIFAWHLRPGALERLTPPWQPMAIIDRQGGIADGGEVTVRTRLGPFPIDWVARHEQYLPGRQFADRQITGPFAAWLHTHRVDPAGEGACSLTDRIDYCLPGGRLGQWLGRRAIRRLLSAAFAYRHTIVRADITMQIQQPVTPKTIAITGSHGMIGQALGPRLTTAGHTVKRVVRRRQTREDEIGWLPDQGWIERDKLAGVDAVVHLAGESIQGRWTAAKKQRIYDSRVQGTRLIAQTLAEVDRGPEVLISASAVGYYGDGGDAWLTEASPQGQGFLAEVAAAWEEAAQPAVTAGVRVTHPRLGAVLSPAGGALKQMLPLFRMGLGGRVGSGQQWLPWVAIDDVCGAIAYALEKPELQGPFNLAAPEPVTNEQFAKTLGRVLGRPAVMPAPGFMLRRAFGQIIDEAILVSQRVQPAQLEACGYSFQFSSLEPALRHLLGKESAAATASP